MSCLQTPVYVYYESLCPDSQAFITKQLYPSMKILKDHVDLHLIPFGKSTVSVMTHVALETDFLKIFLLFMTVSNSRRWHNLRVPSWTERGEQRRSTYSSWICNLLFLSIAIVLWQQAPGLRHQPHPGRLVPAGKHSRDFDRWVYQLPHDQRVCRSALWSVR